MDNTELPLTNMNAQGINLKRRDNIESNGKENMTQNGTKWLFKDYMKKYRPVNVWDRMEKMKIQQGLNISMETDFDEFFDGIDPTDDLLKIQIQPKPESGRRKWFPPGTLNRGIGNRDLFSLRRRIFELILHVIYWTRNKLVIMQTFRKKYSRNKLYKMGYLMSKADLACKSFHRFTYRAVHACLAYRYAWMDRHYPIEVLHSDERMLHKWFDIELLIDLINKNDDSCKSMLRKYDNNRLKAWKFTD